MEAELFNSYVFLQTQGNGTAQRFWWRECFLVFMRSFDGLMGPRTNLTLNTFKTTFIMEIPISLLKREGGRGKRKWGRLQCSMTSKHSVAWCSYKSQWGMEHKPHQWGGTGDLCYCSGLRQSQQKVCVILRHAVTRGCKREKTFQKGAHVPSDVLNPG